MAANSGMAQSAPKPQLGEHGAADSTVQPTSAAASSDAKPASSPNQQIESQCAELFQMASGLKTAVDKTTKDMLSVAVMRQALAIEQLARKVRDEMKPMVKKD